MKSPLQDQMALRKTYITMLTKTMVKKPVQEKYSEALVYFRHIWKIMITTSFQDRVILVKRCYFISGNGMLTTILL